MRAAYWPVVAVVRCPHSHSKVSTSASVRRFDVRGQLIASYENSRGIGVDRRAAARVKGVVVP